MKRPDTVKEYLQGLWQITARCNMLQRRSEYLRDKMLQSASCCRPVAGRVHDSSVQEERLLDLYDTNEEMKRCLDELKSYKAEAEALIRQLPDFQLRSILQDRYLRHRPWEEITDSIFYCQRYVMRLHGKALRALEEPYRAMLARLEEGESA